MVRQKFSVSSKISVFTHIDMKQKRYKSTNLHQKKSTTISKKTKIQPQNSESKTVKWCA